ncbi:hypothetical protein [Priestia megaterium]|uniref:hypothetical protein n=1 Tax=Priestia megaterium TaxID=1404 RepID=UPI000BFE3DB5|nr:hypothetical protein [Priestia megaterium]PGY51518.1 hypothetical protein COE35_13590 [Priestia megaterium]
MIGLYGHRNLNDKLLKEWILNWDEKKYVEYVNSQITIKTVEFNEHLIKHIQLIKEISASEWNGKKGYFFDSILPYMNQFILNCYFRAGSTIASVANFHEILIESADFQTKKVLIKGYDYVEKGNIDIYLDGEIIGSIGQMSNLFWHAFYDEYIVQDDFGGINPIRDIEQELTLQIWKPYIINDYLELEELIEKIIYNCSVNLGLHFKIVKFDSFLKHKGNANQYSLELSHKNQERIPLQYFNFANYTQIGRHKYLAYYQVIEFFYIRAMKKFKGLKIKELDIVKYILAATNCDKEIMEWFCSKKDLLEHYTLRNQQYPSMISVNLQEDIINTVARRIYSIRCSLVHSKEAPENSNFIPNLNDEILDKEVPLIRFIASKVIENSNSV